MGDGVMFAGELETPLARWTFVSMDTKGKSGGMLFGWRSRSRDMALTRKPS